MYCFSKKKKNIKCIDMKYALYLIYNNLNHQAITNHYIRYFFSKLQFNNYVIYI